MTTRLQLLRSSTTGTIPAAGSRMPGELWTNFPDLQLGTIDAAKNAQKLIAVRFFSTGANYAIGDFVVQAGKLYLATAASTAGAFAPANWSQIAALTDIPALYVLPTASTTVLGGVKVDGTTISIASGVISSAGTVSVGAAPPGAPQNGALWYDLGGGQLYTWINDGSSSQWVIAVNQNISGVYLPLGGGTLTGGLTGTTASFSGAVSTGALTVTGALTAAGATLSQALTVTKPYAVAGDEGIVIAPSSGAAILKLKPTAAGIGNYLNGYVGANQRWTICMGDGSAETGTANAGSDFSIVRFSDVGAILDFPFKIARTNGNATFTNMINLLPANGSNGSLYFSALDTLTLANNVAAHPSNIQLDPNSNFIYNAGIGNAYKPGGGAWGVSSDARIKTVKGDYKHGLEAILKLRPVSYVYKGNTDPPAPAQAGDDSAPSMKSGLTLAAEAGTVFVGLVAQEAETVLPELVSKADGWIDGKAVTDLRQLDSSPLVYALINAVKELSARVVALEAGAV